MPRPLGALLVLSFLIGMGWAVATPPLQGPDEEAHLGYAQHLAETGRAPSVSGPATADSTELVVARDIFNLRPLIGNAGARPGWAAADRRAWERVAGRFTDAERANGAGSNQTAKNPPLYYAVEAVPYWLFRWTDVLQRQFAMRLAGVLLYVLTVGLTWLIAAELTPRAWVRFTAAGAVALQPQLAFMSAVINSDVLLAALTTAWVLAAVRLVVRGPSVPRMLALGATAGLAALTHGRGFALVPAAAVVALVALARARPPWRTAIASVVPAAAVLLGLVLAAVLITATTSGGTGALGGELRQNTAVGFDVGQFLSYLWQFYLPRLGFMTPTPGPPSGYRQLYVEGFFGTFASLEVRFSPRTFDLLQVAAAAGLAGLVGAAVARRRELLRCWPAVVALGTPVVCVLGLLHLSAYHDILASPSPGRYLLPLVSAFGLAVAFVCASLPRRGGPIAAAAVLAVGVLLQLGGLGIELTRFYG